MSKYFYAICIAMILGLGYVVVKSPQSKEAPQKHWYGEYCYPESNHCEYHDGKGNDCPYFDNDSDIVSSIALKLKDNTCKVR